jgi:hypothetical protein
MAGTKLKGHTGKGSRSGASTGGAMVLQQARHYMRFIRKDQGETPDAIAKSEGVSVKVVERSIRMVEMHKSLNTQANLNGAVVGMLMSNLPHVDRTFQKLFKAKNYIEQKQPDGSTKLVPIDDTATQGKAIELFGKYVDSMQPKGGGLNLKVSQNNNNQAVAHSNAQTGGYEDMLRDIIDNASSHNALPPRVVDVIDSSDSEDDEDDE